MDAIRPEAAQILVESGALPAARGVDQPPWPPVRFRPPDHSHDRRHPDAARQEQETPGFRIEREIVARRADLELGSAANGTMDIIGPAAAVDGAADRDDIA